MPQTSVDSLAPIGVPGQLADLYTQQHGDIVPATNEEAAAPIPFGVMVKKGTAKGLVKLLAAQADSDDLEGIAVQADVFDPLTQLADVTVGGVVQSAVKSKVTFDVIRKGRVLVRPEDAVTPIAQVHVRCVVAGAETAGAFRAAKDGADTLDISAFARWCGAAGANELVELEIDMNGLALATLDVP